MAFAPFCRNCNSWHWPYKPCRFETETGVSFSTEKIEDILVRRDGMTRDEAFALVAEARGRVHDGERPDEVLEEMFGLEPDYIFQLL